MRVSTGWCQTNYNATHSAYAQTFLSKDTLMAEIR